MADEIKKLSQEKMRTDQEEEENLHEIEDSYHEFMVEMDKLQIPADICVDNFTYSHGVKMERIR